MSNINDDVAIREKAKARYREWVSHEAMDQELKSELLKMDEDEIFEAFYRDLEFGTGGLRGIIGAGTDRMNIYTVRRASQGFADYINERAKASGGKPRIAIAYDSRIKSDEFSRNAAGVFAANGITVHIFRELMPTPALSFAVRHLGADAGIVVTASHNPSKYNGYKAYNDEGCQITLEASQEVLTMIERTDMFKDVRCMDFEEGLSEGMIEYIGDDVVTAFLDAVQRESLNAPTGDGTPDIACSARLNVVYTPLNGAGNRCVREILKRIGVGQVTTVAEQEKPDGNFPTCPYPNPEKKEALALGLELCRKLSLVARSEQDKPDILLATDPDCDRAGIAVRHDGDYILLTGNEVGVLLLDHICRVRSGEVPSPSMTRMMPPAPIAIKTIVSSKMADAVANSYGVQVIDVLTGFKFIGEQIGLLEKKGEEDRFVFGFEESYGYLSGGYVRDKDAVNASMLICETAAYYKSRGMTLVDAMDALYARYGYYRNGLLDFAFEGSEGMAHMGEIMKSFRTEPVKAAAGSSVAAIADYQEQKKTFYSADGDRIRDVAIALPKSDVVEYILENGSSFIVRPSGTEPKIKVYMSAKGETKVASEEIVQKLSEELAARIKA